MVKSKKAQISIEALIITSVLIIGAVIFGSIYLSRLSKETKTAGDLSGLIDDFFKPDPDPEPGPGPDPTPGEYFLQVTLNPPGSSNINQDFQINVKATDGESNPVPSKITKIEVISKWSESPVNYCTYTGQFNFLKDTNLTFTCSVVDTYVIKITAQNDSNSSQFDTKSREKTITNIGSVDSFNIKITEPEDNANFLNTQKFNLKAESDKVIGSCIWYINNEELDSEFNTGCHIEELKIIELINRKIVNIGENLIEVYAKSMENETDKAKIKINIYENNPIALAAPNSVFVGDEFIINVHGTGNLVNENIAYSLFNFENRCSIINNKSCRSEIIDDTTLKICEYIAKCTKPKYDQLGNHEPQKLTVKLTTNQVVVETKFYSIYDLLFEGANCNVNANEYGKINLCVYSTGGVNYNSNYWDDESYGLLKAKVDTSKSSTSNEYGTLTIYVSE